MALFSVTQLVGLAHGQNGVVINRKRNVPNPGDQV